RPARTDVNRDLFDRRRPSDRRNGCPFPGEKFGDPRILSPSRESSVHDSCITQQGRLMQLGQTSLVWCLATTHDGPDRGRRPLTIVLRNAAPARGKALMLTVNIGAGRRSSCKANV